MGRSRGSERISGKSRRMRLTGMSEETGTEPLPGLQQDPSVDSIPTVPLIERFENVETLKCRVQKLALNTDGGGGEWENDSAYPSASVGGSGRESTLSLSSDDTLNCDDCKSESNDTSVTNEGDNTVDNTEYVPSSSTDLKDSLSHHERTNSDTSIKAGLLMSPVLLTEDVTVDVGASNRLSSVLENISLPLLYLPTTKQIVNGDKRAGNVGTSEACSLHGDTSSGSDGLPVNGIESSSLQLQVTGGDGYSASGSMFHTGSSSSDLDRLRAEPDRVTLTSVESFTSNTMFCDPTARLYDTSSLSSISTGTDFSVSAVSLGDEYGESRLVMCDGDEGTFMEVNLHGRNSFEPSRNSSSDSSFEDRGGKPKKKGFSGFLSRYHTFSIKSWYISSFCIIYVFSLALSLSLSLSLFLSLTECLGCPVVSYCGCKN